MTHRAIAVIALAGAAPAVLAQANLNIRADQGHGGAYAISDTITWTVSITGLTSSTFYLQIYDLDFIASDPGAGISSGFNDNLLALIGPEPGTPAGASIFGTWGGQSTLLDPIGTTFGNVVLGTFTTIATAPALLKFDVADGGNQTTDHLGFNTGVFPNALNGRPNVNSDTVYLGGAVPAPMTLAPIALAALTLTRRRR
ncbi:MAG: hypothetical protein DHS20C14_20480 [Phycisphaeraceae bacterium]|nr:MAG: hypothetical protein DHS20C14_20480 [Phycisphaeraceae bacterium]